MTLELFAYIILCLLSLFFAYKEGKFSNMKSLSRKIFAFIIGATWFVIIRLSGFDIDINTYVEYLGNNIEILLIKDSFYFLREFVFWGIFIGGYIILQDKILILLSIDIIVLYFLIKTIINFRLPFYSFFLLLCFFPNLMGYENVYRQYIATILTLYAISIAYKNSFPIRKKEFKSYIFIIIAGLCHNVAFLFFPLLFLLKKRFKLGIFLSLIIFIALPMLSSSKSEGETGEVPVGFFLIITTILYIFYLIINSFRLTKTNIYFLSFVFILITESIIVLTGVASKRIVMFALNIILIFIIISLQRSRFSLISYRFFVLLLCFFMLAPTFLSNSSFQMLLTTNK
ncbi:EpsG family protein [Capnocytophaga sputigena]|uniref:EpsG family protein n=1 Tax=Capnocytophaga sputigena TaxID=1019 RepID=UPI000BB5488D|nr:EpsG family protein [Capnocytophaga sputigena]PBN47935.1 hypothetical protein CDC50_05090 [Capnocytophaga sputigena]